MIDLKAIETAIEPAKTSASVAITQAQADAKSLEQWARNIEIKTQEESTSAGEVLTYCHEQIKTLEEQRKSVVSPLNGVVSTINGWFKPAVNSFESAKNLLKNKIAGFLREQEAEKQRLLEAGKYDQVVAMPQRDRPSEAIKMRDVVKWRLLDETKVPKQYWIINDSLISAMVERLGSACEIPGIEVYTESEPVMRGRR